MSLHYGIIDKTHVIVGARGIVLGRLFATHLLGAIVVDHRLFELISLAAFGEHAHLDKKLAATCRLEIGICKFQVLFPVRNASALSGRIQAERRCIGIEQAVTRR